MGNKLCRSCEGAVTPGIDHKAAIVTCRFEHSIGTAHLAGTFAFHLLQVAKKCGEDPSDIINWSIVEAAGLLSHSACCCTCWAGSLGSHDTDVYVLQASAMTLDMDHSVTVLSISCDKLAIKHGSPCTCFGSAHGTEHPPACLFHTRSFPSSFSD